MIKSLLSFDPEKDIKDQLECVSEQFLNGTSAHIRLFSALPWYCSFT